MNKTKAVTHKQNKQFDLQKLSTTKSKCLIKDDKQFKDPHWLFQGTMNDLGYGRIMINSKYIP